MEYTLEQDMRHETGRTAVNDLIGKILGLIPQYLTDIGSLVVDPSGFLIKKADKVDENFVGALSFFAVSVAIVVLLSWAAFVGRDVSAHLEYTAVKQGVALILFAAALRVCWWAVGGKTTYKTLLTTCSYPSGLGIVAISFSQLLGRGALKLFDPVSYSQMLVDIQHNQNPATLFSSPAMSAMTCIAMAGYVFAMIWYLRTWKVYRMLNGLSKERSAVAMAGTIVLTIPIQIVDSLAGAALLG